MKNKNRLKTLLFSLLTILFTGCDYWCQDEYPHTKIVLEEGSELCGKYYKPDDYRFEDNDLQFWGKWIQHIYANTTPVEYSYWNPEKWTFKSKRRLRKYELIFDKHE